MVAAPDVRHDTWWPSRYGAEDEAGALNEITADSVVAAARLVRTGRASSTSPTSSTWTFLRFRAARSVNT